MRLLAAAIAVLSAPISVDTAATQTVATAALLAEYGISRNAEGLFHKDTRVIDEDSVQNIRQFSVIERSLNDAVVKVGTGSVETEILVWNNPIYDQDNKDQVGSNQGTCTQVPERINSCMYTFKFDSKGEDQIMAQGSFPPTRDPVEFAAVGGTGQYEGAVGTVTLFYLEFSSGETPIFEYKFDVRLGY